jgi:selenocysteine-specific elongation factor
VQLRLEEPLVARARDRVVLRSYSPVTTIGGGSVAEPTPPKRNRLGGPLRSSLAAVLEGDASEAVQAALDVGGWRGVSRSVLPIVTGLTLAEARAALEALESAGSVLLTPSHAFGPAVAREAKERTLRAVEAEQEADALRPAIPLAIVRAALPAWAHPDAADTAIAALVAEGALESGDGGVRTPGFEVRMSADQEAAATALMEALVADGLGAPLVEELPGPLTARPDFRSLLRWLEAQDRIRSVADGLYVASAELDAAAERIRAGLTGRKGLGPADFRDVLPVTRKHLIPLLNYFDGQGTTRRGPDGSRDVPDAAT